MAIADGAGLSCRHYHRLGLAARNPTRCANAERQLPADNPVRLIGDAAYDSDGLDRMLADCGNMV